MATWEEILNANPRTTATGGQRTTPAVVRRSDVMRLPPPTKTESWSLGADKPKSKEAGGLMGVLQDILESPVGKVVGKAGEIISLPGRVIPSVAQEIADALDSDPNTNASWNDLGKQITDPTFGWGTVFGDVFSDDSFWGRWGNRALGFVGDIVTDPLTYVTFGGSRALRIGSEVAGETAEQLSKRAARIGFNPVTGRSGREALAVRVLEKTGDADLAKRAYRYGRSALADQKDEVFETLGMDRAGVYFMGRRVGFTRTGQALEGSLASMRTWSGDHLFKRAADVFTPDDVADARKALARGTAPTERAAKYLHMVVSDNTRRKAVGAASRKASALVDGLIKEVGEKDFRAATPNVRKILEGELPFVDPVTGLATTVEQRVAGKLRDWFDVLWNDIDTAAKAVDPAYEASRVKNYFPHMMTDDALFYVTSKNTKNTSALREILFNPLDNAGSFKHRMTLDDEFFGVPLKDIDGPITVDRLNKIANDAGFKGEFFETNAATVMQKYVGSYAEQMGLIARKQYLVEKGVFQPLSDVLKKSDPQVLKDAKKALKLATERRTAAISSAASKAREALSAVNKQALTAAGIYDAGILLDDAIADMLEHSNRLSALYEEVPDVIRSLESDYEAVVARLEFARAALTEPQARLEDVQRALVRAEADAQRLFNIEEEIGKVGAFIQENLDKIMNEGSFSGSDAITNLARELKEAVSTGVPVDVEGKRVEALIAASKESWWKVANPDNSITVDSLKNMSEKRVAEIVESSIRGNATVGEMRQALLWVASANPRLRTSQPEMWESLFGPNGVMRKAADADRIHRSLNESRFKGRRAATIAARRSNLISAERSLAVGIREYVASRRLANEFLNADTVMGRAIADAKIAQPMDRLAELLVRPEYMAVRHYFDGLLGLAEDAGFQGVPRELDVDDIMKILKGIGSNFENSKSITVTVGYDTTGKIGSKAIEKSLTIDMSNMVDDVEWLIRYGDNDDVDSYIEGITRGTITDSITVPTQKSRGARRGGKIVDIGKEKRPVDAGKGARDRLQARILGFEDSAEFREELAEKALREGDALGSAIQSVKAIGNYFDANAIKKSLVEVVKREARENSLRGQLQALDAEIAREFPDIPVQYFGTEINKRGKLIGGVRDVADVVRSDSSDQLQDLLTKLWFVADVEKRIAATVDVYASANMVPGLGVVQEIYNRVARDFLDRIGSVSESQANAWSALRDIQYKILNGEYDSPAKAYEAIEEAIKTPAISRAVAKARGNADAPRLLRKLNQFGGLRSSTVEFKELKATNLDVAQSMRKEMIEELRDWYQAVFPGAKRNTGLPIIKEQLEIIVKSEPGVKRKIGNKWVTVERYGPNASMEELSSWLAETIKSVGGDNRSTRRNVLWLQRAADPFIDPYDKAVFGSRQWNVNVPSSLGASLRATAAQLEEAVAAVRLADEASAAAKQALEKQQTELSELELLAETLGIPAGQRPRMPLTKAQREGMTQEDLSKVRDVVRSIFEIKNSPDYLAAVERRGLNDVIMMLADVASEGGVKIPLVRTHVTKARELFDTGIEIFIRRDENSKWVPVTSRGQITDDVKPGNVGQKYWSLARGTTKRDGGQFVPDAAKNVRNKKTIEKFYKRIDELDAMRTSRKISEKKYQAEINKIYDDLDRLGRNTESVSQTENIVPILSEGKEELRKYVRSLENQRTKLVIEKNNIQGGVGSITDETAAKLRAAKQVEIDELSKSIEEANVKLSRRIDASRFVQRDGSDIQFSAEEIESLFLTAGDTAGVERLAAEGRRVDTYLLELEYNRTNGRIGNAVKKLLREQQMSDETRALLERWLSRPSTTYGDRPLEFVSAAGSKVSFFEAIVKPTIDAEIKRLTEYRNRIQMLIRASQPDVQRSALMKAHFINQGLKNGDFTIDELTGGISRLPRNSSPWQTTARRGHLERVWSQSVDKKVLDKVDELERTAQAAKYREIVKSKEAAADLAARMREQADKLDTDARGKLGVAEGIATKMVQTMEQMTSRLGDDIEYDVMARYDQLVNPIQGSRSKRLKPTEAIEKIRDEILELRPIEKGPVGPSGTMLVRGADDAANAAEIKRLADQAIYYSKELEPNFDMATGRMTLGLEVSLRKRAVAAIADQKEDLAGELEKTKKAWAKEQKALAKPLKSAAKDAQKRLVKAGKTQVDAMAKFDSAELFAMSAAEYAETIIPKLHANRERLATLMGDIEKFLKRTDNDMAFVGDVLAWLDEADSIIDDLLPQSSADQIDIMTRLRTDLANLEYEFMSSTNQEQFLQKFNAGLADGTVGQRIVKEVDKAKGFVSLQAYGMPSYQAEKWLSDMYVNMSRLQVPEFARALSKFLSKYTGFFKAYAVSTPGFVVRNSMGNTFMCIAGGADIGNMTEGLRLYRAWRGAVKTGDEAGWLAKQDPRVTTAIAAMDASGYGRATEALRMFNPKRKWLVDNGYVNAFRKANEVSEGSARFMLAWDTVVKGGDFNDATARVKRFLFDYSTTTPADTVMRQFVPFWFWMSRNLPMQIVNQYENPRAYLMYQRVTNSIRAEEDEGEVVPKWLRESGGVKIADGLYVNPDFGFNKLNQQLSELADPMRLTSYVNPGLRVPLEAVFAKRKMYTDTQFSEKAQEVTGGAFSPAVSALAVLLGQSKELPDGSMGTTDRFNYAMNNLVPPLAQLSRLSGEDDYNKERRRSNWASYFGIPVREVTDSMIEAELRRRKREGE